MLNQTHLNQIMTNLGITADGRAIIDRVRTSAPSRSVQGAAGNVACRYPSKKMGLIIQAESHTNELAALYHWDHDSVTHEFYDQPEQIKLNYIDIAGKNKGYLTTPDFFIVQDDFIGWVECKTEEWLEKKAEEKSPIFVRTVDGRWTSPPAVDFAAQYGLGFKVRSSIEQPWQYTRNLAFLSDYWNASRPDDYDARKSEILRELRTVGWCNLAELLRLIPGIADTVYHAIACDELYVNLAEELLAQPEFTKVYRSQVLAEACMLQASSTNTSTCEKSLDVYSVALEVGEKLDWDGALYTIKSIGDRSIYLENMNGKIVTLARNQLDLLMCNGEIKGLTPAASSSEFQLMKEQVIFNAAPTDLENATQRHQLLAELDTNPNLAGGPSPRTIRRWRQSRRRGETVYGDSFTGLISHVAGRGNSNRKIDNRVLTVMSEVIENDLKGRNAKSKTTCYGILSAKCKDLKLIPPSEKTFRREIGQSKSQFELTVAREGARAAYKFEPFIFELSHSTPRHGDRPFEIAHIDHTELDLQFVGSKFGEQLKRPWLTLMLDAYSRSVLAFVLTFDPPSYRSCMLVMRECIRRHQRAPSTLVVDRGAEFDSTYFETLLARLSTLKKSRPPQKPRFGSIMERFFGCANTQLIHNLRGNNKPLQTPRQMSSTHDPRERAVWTLAEFIPRFESYLYELYGNLDHPVLGVSPNAAFKLGLSKTGLRPMRMIPFSQDIELLCLPSTPKGTARIKEGRGIKINYLYYWHPIMSNQKFANADVVVRYDPFNLGTSYAFIDGTWRPCESELSEVFDGRTEREIAIIAAEIGAKNKLAGPRRAINAEAIARFILGLEGTEVLLLQQKRDAERRNCGPESAEESDLEGDFEEASAELNRISVWNNTDVPTFGVFK